MALTRLDRYRTLRNEDGREMNPELSSYSSMDSLHDPYCSDVPSEDLDKLSTCLSEASSDSNEPKETSVFTDILQAQLALWTLFGSIFYTYAWQQHRKKFLFSLFVVVPPVALVCCTISSMLTCIVILGRVFSSPVRFEDMLNYKSNDMTDNGIRRRSTSINSLNSSASGRSSSCEELPKPVCRKHSNTYGSYNSLNQISLRSTSPSMYSNGSLNGRCGPSPSHKLSYTFAHCSGGADEVAN